MKYKKLLSFLLVFIMLLYNTIYADENANLDSVGINWGTLEHDIRTNDMWESQGDVSLAKISFYDEKNEKIDTFIVSNYGGDTLSELNLMSNMNKLEYSKLNGNLNDKINDYLNINDDCLNLKCNNIIQISDFPQLLMKTDEGNVYQQTKSYFEDKDKLTELLSSCRVNPDNINSLNILVEPMGLYKVNEGTTDDPDSYKNTEKVIALTSAEIGLLTYNDHPLFNCNILDDSGNITPFKDYYHTQLYQTMPFSCYKNDIGVFNSINPCDDGYKNAWTINIGFREQLLDMINNLGCFEISFNLGNRREEVATDSKIEREPADKYIEYYTGCWVITSVKVSSIHGFPYQSDTPGTAISTNNAKENCLDGTGLAKITFEFESNEELNTETYTHSIVIPENGNALAWVKWKTPDNPCNIIINISADSEDASLEAEHIEISVIDPAYNTYPPNTNATDRNDSFIVPSYAEGSWNIGNQKKLSWDTYTYTWHYDWHYICRNRHGDEECLNEISEEEYNTYGEGGRYDEYEEENEEGRVRTIREYSHICNSCSCNYTENISENHRHKHCTFIKEDWGWVEWEKISHTLSLSFSNETLKRSSNSPNTNNSDYSIKSGYGIEIYVDTSLKYEKDEVNSSLSSVINDIAPPQVMETFLPEYHFETYEIVSKNEIEDTDTTNSFTFPVNPYSQFEQKCHFTPLWYPNGKYVVGVKLGQCFCPAGMLFLCLDDISININGNAYDDWHIAPERN